ncbi:hypothetical protein O6H91_11G027500 [Diphasiastrum complanatum]|uniref:Uncharacterized protein n=1 Tax=Diphasiastrum complanatum TaxID=34168 RepID=A0ACC2C7D0_DIPCM|nr:hypothetical protein O6H91_11G027500 [Diphasiastrum complanatum]
MKRPLKGTPHPRPRKPLEVITNRQAAVTVKKQIKKEAVSFQKSVDKAGNSPLRRLHVVHNNVTKLVQQIDGMVVGAHKLKLAGKLSAQEIDSFLKAISQIENTMQEWNNLFVQAAKRPPSQLEGCPRNTEVEYRVANQQMQELSLGQSNQCLLSSSPLVPESSENLNKTRTVLLFLTPDQPPPSSIRKKVTFARDPLIKSCSAPSSPRSVRGTAINPDCTPSLNGLDSTLKSASTFDFPLTPAMPSPPRSVMIRRPSLSSSSSCPSTPSFAQCKTDHSEDLATPRPPIDILAKYPKWFSQFQSSGGKSSSASSGIDTISPPRTCALIKPSPFSSSDQEHDLPLKSPMLALSSPFHTPGLVLTLPKFGGNSKLDEESLEKWGW